MAWGDGPVGETRRRLCARSHDAAESEVPAGAAGDAVFSGRAGARSSFPGARRWAGGGEAAGFCWPRRRAGPRSRARRQGVVAVPTPDVSSRGEVRSAAVHR
jgi:hypothetical protein